MTKGVGRVVIVCATALVLNSSAHAASITLSGGTAGTIPGGSANDFIPSLLPGSTIGGYFGADFELNVPGTARMEIDFFGAEAGYVNSFEFFGSTVFTHPGGTIIAPSLGSPLDSIAGLISGAGVLPFRFLVNSSAGSVANGANPDDSGGAVSGPNFFASCDPFGSLAGSGGTSCRSVYLFLDDGGAGPDDDFDDLLVRISVPEPATLALLSLGLLGFALRRRQQ